MAKGIYILANDRVIPWLVALLNSLRFNAPGCAVCLIPYDQRCGILRSVAEQFGASIFENDAILEECDRIAMAFHNQVRGDYRKLACWEGPYSDFIYIDVDSIVTFRLEWLFQVLKGWDIVFSDGPCPANRPYVWNTSMSDQGRFSEDELAFSANAGFFVSTRCAFPIEKVKSLMPEALCFREHMDLGAADQPFLNFIVLAAHSKYTSVSALNQGAAMKKTLWSLWGGSMGGLSLGGSLYLAFPKKKLLFPPKRVFLVHWAGDTTKARGEGSWWKDALCENRTEDGRLVTWFRYERLWNYYAYDIRGCGVSLKQMRKANPAN